MGIIGTLGTMPFSCAQGFVNTFHAMSRDLGERYGEHNVIGKKPVLEHVGPELVSIKLGMRFDSSLGAAPSLCMKLLKTMMESGMPHMLIVGGEYLGRFVIESISEDRRHWSGMGVCMVAEVSVSLKEAA